MPSPSEKRVVRRLVLPAAVACAVGLLVACSSSRQTTPSPEAAPASPAPIEDASPTTAVVDSMTGDMLRGQWLQQWTKEHEESPTVIVGPIENQTRRIDEKTVIQHVSRRLINADTVQEDLERGKNLRSALRQERVQACSGRFPSWREVGADFMVHGTIRSAVEEERKNDAVLLYTVDLELINIKTNVKSWEQKTEFKKIVAQQELEVPPAPPKDSGRSTAGMQQGGC